ncbi:hypothetical protein KA005_62285 [bacterium]|nr:hypothetical protein [bacterium]
MNVNLRFGLQRDKETIRNLQEKIDGLVIPAHILSYQADVTSVFVSSFSDMPFIIDPMTYLLQHSKDNLTNDVGNLRASIAKMCDEYVFDIEEELTGNRQLRPSNIPDSRHFCNHVYDFQNSVEEKANTKKAIKKYLDRYGKGNSFTPRFIISPYFKFNSISDPWYMLSLNMGKMMQTICSEKGDGLDAGAIIFSSADNLDDEAIEKIASDYEDFSYIVLWFEDFNEMAVDSTAIVNARKIISALSDFAEVEILYSGFLLMTTAAEGAKAVSHGLTYSQHKSFRVTPGGGGMPERYYIPKFRAFRSLSQTDNIFHMRQELMCNCPVCDELLQGNPDNIVLFADEPEKLREHFINVRRQEADDMESFNRQSLVEDLRNVYGTYHNLISKLPNPDAFLSGRNMSGLKYLSLWAEGIAETI